MSRRRPTATTLVALLLASCSASPPMPDPSPDNPASVMAESSPRGEPTDTLAIARTEDR